MDTKLILLTILGLTLVFSPMALGIRYVKEWLSENNRLDRRIRDLE
jgi:hypothetical protein